MSKLPTVNLPIKTVTLPSGLKLKVRSYSYGEERILLMAKQSGKIEDIMAAVGQILSNCIVTSEVNIPRLASFDVEYLMVQLRGLSVGEALDLSKKIEACDDERCPKEMLAKLDLATVALSGPLPPKPRIKLNDTSFLCLTYPTLENMKIISLAKVEDMILESIVHCIDQIIDGESVLYPDDFTPDELRQWVLTFREDQFVEIADFIGKIPRMEQQVPFKCPKCGKIDKVNFSGFDSFFA